ncbi:MAG: hypothetical protein ACI9MR_005004 [Myxococcota bacterium]
MEAHTPNRDAAIDTHVARRQSRLARSLGDELYPEAPAVAEVAALYASHHPAQPETDADQACRQLATQVVNLSHCLDAVLDGTRTAAPSVTSQVTDLSSALTAIVPQADTELLFRVLEHARAVHGDAYTPDWETARTHLLDTLVAARTPRFGDPV